MATRETAGAPTSEPRVYSPVARFFHWATAVLVIVTIPIAIVMSGRAERNIWDATTNLLFDTHKTIGLVVLALAVLRLAYRLTRGAPADEPTLTAFQRATSHIVHWSLYGLLIMVPLGGIAGLSFHGMRGIFGTDLIPTLGIENEDLGRTVLAIHRAAGFLMAVLVIAHVGGALYHHLVQRDGVLRRMLPGLRSRRPD